MQRFVEIQCNVRQYKRQSEDQIYDKNWYNEKNKCLEALIASNYYNISTFSPASKLILILNVKVENENKQAVL